MMRNSPIHSASRFFAQLLFIVLPVAFITCLLLYNAHLYFSIVKGQWLQQTIYFSCGMVLAFLLAKSRLRFIPIFAALLASFFSVYALLDNYAFGEFDGFFISVQFLVFAYLFSAGWCVGWMLERVRFANILLAGLYAAVAMFLIAKTGDFTNVETFIRFLTPVALFSMYMLFIGEAIRHNKESGWKFWFHFTKRLLAFVLLFVCLYSLVIYAMYPNIKEKLEEYGRDGKEGENQFLETKKDGTVQNRQSMGLGANNNRNKNPEPLFCAHIESYLPGTDIPNPLYLTSWHFTKYDTITETFERDSANPWNDEFQPDPSKIPLFSMVEDSIPIRKALGTKNRKVVELEIYKKRLSASTFIAPSTAYWVQPITVEKEFQKEFSSAYRCKSYVSNWNSAYFIYNTEEPQIKQFQELRFQELRKAKPVTSIPKTFYDYYTFFPSANSYKAIQQLADSLSLGKKTTIDKVLAVRDYFLQRNASGDRIFTYTDNPGVPGLPGSSKLMYFLFESKKGYCAYYAGATLFLLRAMKIPSRIVTGFLTVDRSDKNPGWYWFYEDQSHGWVQVYFPEYGWIDFDTTVGNEEAEQSPAPDGTPPLQPPNAILAMAAKVTSVDTMLKKLSVRVSSFMFKDKEYASIQESLLLDVSTSSIWKDSVQLPLAKLQKGDDIMAVSYREKLKALSLEKDVQALLRKFPKAIPIDEVYVKELETEKVPTRKGTDNLHTMTWKEYALAFLTAFLLLLLLLFSLPQLTYWYFVLRMKLATKQNMKLYFSYHASSFLVHQLGVYRSGKTPYQFAKEQVDPMFQTKFTKFMQLYLQVKYSSIALSEKENDFVKNFHPYFAKAIKTYFRPFERVKRFLHLKSYLLYFYLSEPERNS